MRSCLRAKLISVALPRHRIIPRTIVVDRSNIPQIQLLPALITSCRSMHNPCRNYVPPLWAQRTPRLGSIKGQLCSNQWLILALQSVGGLPNRWSGLELLLWRGREILALEAWNVLLLDQRLSLGWLGRCNRGGRSSTSAANQLLCLLGVVSNILFGSLGSAGGMVAGELSDLFGLLVCNVRSLREVLVDELLVRLVDKRRKEQNGGRDKRETPEWDKFDQVVGDECAEESLRMVSRVCR
jgi:hypothetical protein